MAATGRYVDQTNVTVRLTSRVLIAIFNDEGDGSLSTSEEDAIEEFILDAESLVEQQIRKTYKTAGLTWLRAQGTSAPRAVKRMVLDLFEVFAYRRHPEYVRAEWQEREAAVRRDLEALRVRELELDTVSSPEPAANEGGTVESGDPDDTTPAAKFFVNGLGAF
jgi:hypothetical protein